MSCSNMVVGLSGWRNAVDSHQLSLGFDFGERPLLLRRAQWYTPTIGRRATFAAYAMMAAGLALGAAFYVAQAARP